MKGVFGNLSLIHYQNISFSIIGIGFIIANRLNGYFVNVGSSPEIPQ